MLLQSCSIPDKIAAIIIFSLKWFINSHTLWNLKAMALAQTAASLLDT